MTLLQSPPCSTGFSITATGVTGTVGGPTPVRAEGPSLFSADRNLLDRSFDGGMEMRERAWAELRYKVRGRSPRRGDLSNVVGNILYLNVVRIR